MKISKNYTSDYYNKLNLDFNNQSDWDKAINILKERIEERFFYSIDLLISSEKDNKPKDNTFWFSILAISCLLIETIQWFKEGIYNHNWKSKRLIKNFCKDIWLDDKEQNIIYFNIRCWVLHKWEIENCLLFSHNGNENIITKYSEDEIVIERTIFYKKIKEEFYNYLNKLKYERGLKINYIKVMNWICWI